MSKVRRGGWVLDEEKTSVGKPEGLLERVDRRLGGWSGGCVLGGFQLSIWEMEGG